MSEKLPTSLPRSLSWIQVLVGAPVCWRREEFGRGTWTGFDPEDLAGPEETSEMLEMEATIT